VAQSPTTTLVEALGPKAEELTVEAADILASSVASTRPNAHLLPVEEARRNFDADFAEVGSGEDVAEIREHRVPVDGPQGQTIAVREFRPSAESLPTVVYFHGGGWLLGSLDSHQAVCRALANATRAAVFSVDYRRGPESRFPTAVEDAYAATVWVADNAEALGLVPNKLALAGDSAGGNLATVVAMLARDRGGPEPAMQVLAYPVTTTDLSIGFDDSYEGFFLYRDELQWHQDNYLPDPDRASDPLVSPLDHGELSGLPPTLVLTAQCDPLHAQGELYADALRRAGVPVEHRQWPGMVHGFFQLPTVFPEGAEAVDTAAQALRRSLA
jgi:acetyl esterase/lipase